MLTPLVITEPEWDHVAALAFDHIDGG